MTTAPQLERGGGRSRRVPKYEAHVFVLANEQDFAELAAIVGSEGFRLSDRSKARKDGRRDYIATRNHSKKRLITRSMRAAAAVLSERGFHPYRLRLEQTVMDELVRKGNSGAVAAVRPAHAQTSAAFDGEPHSARI